jgi:hypothetical protein
VAKLYQRSLLNKALWRFRGKVGLTALVPVMNRSSQLTLHASGLPDQLKNYSWFWLEIDYI